MPFVPVSDAAAEVVGLGPGVTEFELGDRVAACFRQGWAAGDVPPSNARTLGGPGPGLLRKYATLPAVNLVRIPGYLSDEEASTLPIAALTAWEALIQQGGLKPGQTVLAQGTGGVSIFGLQLAKLAGARVIVTSSSDAKLERARLLGADQIINYRIHPDWSKKVLEFTDGRGADHILEIGGANTFAQSLGSIALGGKVHVIGYLAGLAPTVDPFQILKRRARVHGALVGSQASFLELNRALTVHRLKPVIDRVFHWQDAVQAFRHLQSGQHFGKIVIRVA